jgi:DNA-binding NarL/FixJ family response regulator
MPTDRKIQLLVADDQEIVRLGLKSLLTGTEIKVVAEAATGQVAVKLALEKDLDLVLLDVRMPEGDGLTALSRIKLDKPGLPVLLFSAFDNAASIAKAVALGASGFLLKDCTRDELLSAIRTAAAGESIWSKEKLRSASRSLSAPGLAGSLEVFLTDREGDVLRQMALGLTNKQVATALNISYETVKEYVQYIFRKIGVTDRTQAALWAVRNDLM